MSEDPRASREVLKEIDRLFHKLSKDYLEEKGRCGHCGAEANLRGKKIIITVKLGDTVPLEVTEFSLYGMPLEIE